MVQLVGSQNYTAASFSFTLTNGSQAGRGVVVVETQRRNPPDISTAITLDGVPATNSWVLNSPTWATDGAVMVAYWADADLPAAAGSFTVNTTDDPAIGSIFEISGWDGAAPEILQETLLSGAWSNPYLTPFTSSTVDAFMVCGAVSETTAAFGTDAGQTEQSAGTNQVIIYKVDSANDGGITLIASDTAGLVYSALAFNAASTGPTLTTTLVADANDTALPSAIDWFVRVDDANNALVGTATITTAGPVSISDSDLTLETGMSLADATQYRVDFQEVGGTRQRTVTLTAAV